MPDPLQLLLDLQAHDLAADQLTHRRATLPDRASLADRQAAIRSIDTELATVGERLAGVERAQKRLEDEVASVQAKADAENARMYSGSVTSPRELQAMQEEIDSLHRRQRSLEDDDLVLMEDAEPLSDAVASLRADRAGHEADSVRLAAAVASSEAEMDAQLEAMAGERAALVADLPADLLSTYDKLRGQLGGVAVARLEGTQCTGCHLSLPAMEVAAVRKADPTNLVFHEECGRILVR